MLLFYSLSHTDKLHKALAFSWPRGASVISKIPAVSSLSIIISNLIAIQSTDSRKSLESFMGRSNNITYVIEAKALSR